MRLVSRKEFSKILGERECQSQGHAEKEKNEDKKRSSTVNGYLFAHVVCVAWPSWRYHYLIL